MAIEKTKFELKKTGLIRIIGLIIAIALCSLVCAHSARAEPTDEAKKLCFDGVESLDQGNYKEAVDLLTKAIDMSTDYGPAIGNRGRAYLALNDLDNALPDFDRAIELVPDGDIFWYCRGALYTRKKEYDKAIADCNHAIEIDQTTGAYLNLGMAYSGKGDQKAAIKNITAGINLDPTAWIGYVFRGNAYNASGQYDMAIADFNRAIKGNPKILKAYIGRGHSNSFLKKLALTVADYTYAINNGPAADDLEVYRDRAKTYVVMAKYPLAIADLKTLIAQTQPPQVANLWIELGWDQYLAGLYPDAAASDLQAIAVDDTWAEAHLNLGLVYAVQDDWDKAKAEIENGLKTAKPDALQTNLKHFGIALTLHPKSKALPQALAMLKAAPPAPVK